MTGKSLLGLFMLTACCLGSPLFASEIHCPYPNAIQTPKQGYVTHKVGGIEFKTPHHFECLQSIVKGTYYDFFATIDSDGSINCNYIYSANKPTATHNKQATANSMANTNFSCTAYIQANAPHAKPANKNWHYNANTQTWSCPYGDRASVDPKQCPIKIKQ